ncbi:YSIRK-type signal peptide-containing protein [Staphylococcus xylosus]|uniref:YSIRK-type signal peptide-containing protein n=1 Tax=Staphylococcus xylosus TaxID=1288 RepID=A0A939SRH8_STAXY|nr:YSIRK-type signal peptide-containing protein [Staphylococcus xylosus]
MWYLYYQEGKVDSYESTAEYIARRNNKYSIRKFTIGTASVLLGSILFINQDSEAEAHMMSKERLKYK